MVTTSDSPKRARKVQWAVQCDSPLGIARRRPAWNVRKMDVRDHSLVIFDGSTGFEPSGFADAALRHR